MKEEEEEEEEQEGGERLALWTPSGRGGGYTTGALGREGSGNKGSGKGPGPEGWENENSSSQCVLLVQSLKHFGRRRTSFVKAISLLCTCQILKCSKERKND